MDTERSPSSKKVPSASKQASGNSTLISSLDNMVTYLVLGALVVAINVALIICIVDLVHILNNPIGNPDIPLPLTYENTTQPDAVNEVASSPTSTTAKTNPANQLAEEVMKYMNLSVCPCDDFYSFACGGWHVMKEVADSTVEISRISIMRERTRQQLIDLLRKTPKEEDPHYKTEPRKCFAACNNKEDLQERGTKPFLVFLNSIGKFPILDSNWDPDTSFTLPNAIQKLSPLGITTIFSIKRVDYEGDIYFHIGVPDFQLPLRGDEAWMKYILQLLGVNTNDASIKKDIDDMFEFENILYDLSKDMGEISVTKIPPIEEFQADMPNWFNAVDFFKSLAAGNITEQQGINSKTYILLYPSPYAPNVGRLFSESGGGLDKKTGQPFSPQQIRRAADNYILKVLLSLTSWTDPKFKSLKEFNYPQNNNRETTCMDHVLKLFPEQLFRMYVDEVYPSKSDTFIKELSTDIKASILQRMKETTLIEAFEKKISHNVVESVGIKAGFLNIVPEEVLNNVYKMGPTDEFFEYSLETLKHEYNKSLWSVKEMWYSLAFSFFADPTYFYADRSQYFVVPPPFLQPPTMSLAWPRSMNNGAIGTFLSHVMLTAWPSTFGSESFTNTAINVKKRKCLIDKYDKYMFQGSKVNGQATHTRNMYDNEGIKSSFRAYQNFIKSKGMEQQLTGLNFTHNQLFFISYAQMLCQKIPKGLTDVAVSQNIAPNKIRVLGSLMNFNGFAEVFKCKSGAVMNPPSKCPFI